MDDFGTGYSSLSYLQRFPFDRIKIDRSFVQGLSDNQDSAAIVGAVVALGRSLKMATTAEGFETLRQFIYLKQEACDEVQGFYFGRPMPADRLAEVLRRGVVGEDVAVR
jgi:EAL domain-containing protein (putative c-di-GMP-specific phosphodiesterase class I)